MSRIGKAALLLLFLGASSTQAQEPSIDQLSPIELKEADFYSTIAKPGQAVKVEWKLVPNNATPASDMALSLHIRGTVNPKELQRPKLRGRAEFDAIFATIEDGTVQLEADEVIFEYTLRPRNAGTFEVPALKYKYYFPQFPEGRRFQTTFANPIPFTIVAPIATPTPKVPLDIPDSMLKLSSEAELRSQSRIAPPSWAWVALSFSVIVSVQLAVLLLRIAFPDAARLAKIRQNRSARIALNELRKSHGAADPAAAVASIFRNYLVARFQVNATAQTPDEVADAMIEALMRIEQILSVIELMKTCDELRFAANPCALFSPAERAQQLIEEWEGANL